MNIEIIKKIPIELLLLEFYNTLDSFNYKYNLNKFEMFINEDNQLQATLDYYDEIIKKLDLSYKKSQDINILLDKNDMIAEQKSYAYKKSRQIKCMETFHYALACLRKSEYDLFDKYFPITRENNDYLYIATKGQLICFNKKNNNISVLYIDKKDKDKFSTKLNGVEKL